MSQQAPWTSGAILPAVAAVIATVERERPRQAGERIPIRSSPNLPAGGEAIPNAPRLSGQGFRGVGGSPPVADQDRAAGHHAASAPAGVLS
jgi:hypothetical protein